MHPSRGRFIRPVALAALILLAGTRVSSATAPSAVVDPSSPRVVAPDQVSSACTLEPGPLDVTVSYTWGDEAWKWIAWRIPRGSCTACPTGSALAIRSVSFRVRWVYACAGTADVSIVAAGGDPACPGPDTTQVICPSVSIPVSGENSAVVYTVPMPADCCVFEDAYVLVRFTGFEQCGPTTPALTRASAPCDLCEEFFTATTLYPTSTDLCTLSQIQPIWIQLQADCCSPTPTTPRSWGRVKTLYR